MLRVRWSHNPDDGFSTKSYPQGYEFDIEDSHLIISNPETNEEVEVFAPSVWLTVSRDLDEITPTTGGKD